MNIGMLHNGLFFPETSSPSCDFVRPLLVSYSLLFSNLVIFLSKVHNSPTETWAIRNNN